MAEKSNTSTYLILGGIGAAAYYFWPQISAELASLTGQTTTTSTTGSGTTGSSTAPAGAQSTNNSPTINTPGAVPIGSQGCFSYSGVISCPVGVSPPPASNPVNNCPVNYVLNANGACTAVIPRPTPAASYAARLRPQVLSSTSSNGAGTPGTAATGTAPPATATLPGAKGKKLLGIGTVASALPMTNGILIDASHNPDSAAIVGNDPRGLLTVPQWNYFYTQASGIVQTIPQHPSGQPGARVNAMQYHAIRQAAGLPVRLGTLRPADPRMFPLGGIRNGPDRVPYVAKGNRNIWRIPGQGAVIGPRRSALGLIADGGGDHRSARSPFPRPAEWRRAE